MIERPNDCVLLPQEYTQVHQALQNVRSNLHSLNDEISRAEARLAALRLKRNAKRRVARVDNLAVAIAPHKRLPPEIPSDILALVRPSNPSAPSIMSITFQYQPHYAYAFSGPWRRSAVAGVRWY